MFETLCELELYLRIYTPAETVETFPTPMEEPRKVCKAWYLGSLQVLYCH